MLISSRLTLRIFVTSNSFQLSLKINITSYTKKMTKRREFQKESHGKKKEKWVKLIICDNNEKESDPYHCWWWIIMSSNSCEYNEASLAFGYKKPQENFRKPRSEQYPTKMKEDIFFERKKNEYFIILHNSLSSTISLLSVPWEGSTFWKTLNNQ